MGLEECVTPRQMTPTLLIYLGSFELVEGYNELTLHHFCPLFRQGLCEGLHLGDI